MSLAPPAGLAALASCNLKELHLKRADGSRMLDTLYQACRSSGQIPVGAPEHSTPTDRYLAVFDAALHSCMGCWILDYVQLVCADRHLTSNDPLEAYLLDGGFVKTWAQGCLQRAEAQVSAALQTDAAFRSCEEQLQRQLSQARVLVAVLRALDAIRAGAAGGQGVGAAAAAGQDRWVWRSDAALRQVAAAGLGEHAPSACPEQPFAACVACTPIRTGAG